MFVIYSTVKILFCICCNQIFGSPTMSEEECSTFISKIICFCSPTLMLFQHFCPVCYSQAGSSFSWWKALISLKTNLCLWTKEHQLLCKNGYSMLLWRRFSVWQSFGMKKRPSDFSFGVVHNVCKGGEGKI